MRIVQSYKQDGKAKHRTLYSLGKVEDYTPAQLENLAKKLIELAGKSMILMAATVSANRHGIITDMLWSLKHSGKLFILIS